MCGYRTRLTGVGLALVALATLIIASFGHVASHADSSLDDSAGQKLECRLPFSALAEGRHCPPLEPDHFECAVCLAANTASAGLLPATVVVKTQVVLGAIAYRTPTAAIAGVVALPFHARDPPSA